MEQYSRDLHVPIRKSEVAPPGPRSHTFACPKSSLPVVTIIPTGISRQRHSMSNQIDPRLYGPLSHPSSSTQASTHGRYETPRTSRLPPLDQTHQLPPLSNNAPLQQPYYRLPPASAPLHQRTPTSLENSIEPSGPPYDPAQSHHGFHHDEQLSPSGYVH